MTPPNRFIDFLRENPEIWAALNEAWKKRGVRRGDWAWDAGTKTGKARLVTSTATHTPSLDFVLDGVAKRWTAEVDWLPSLGQLLGMVEGMHLAYDLGKFEGEYSIRAHQPHVTDEGLDWEEMGAESSLDCMEIAAASLWWRLRGEG